MLNIKNIKINLKNYKNLKKVPKSTFFGIDNPNKMNYNWA